MDYWLEAYVRIFENSYIYYAYWLFSKTLKGHFYVLLGYQSSVNKCNKVERTLEGGEVEKFWENSLLYQSI